jgi:hypothetical protein
MYYRGDGLGIDPVTAYTTYQTANKLIQESRALWDAHPLDKSRFQANLEAAQAALNGDDDALAYLHQRSGRYTAAVVNYSPGAYPHDMAQPISGWATAEPKADAARKEQQVIESRRGFSGVVAGVTGNSLFPWLVGGALAFALLRRRGR